jgi:hypothetical protein
MSRLLRAALSLGAAGAFVVACASPTLPLPPPEIPDVESDGLPAGEVKLVGMAGGAIPGSYIVTINDNPTLPSDDQVGGGGVHSDGSWDAIVHASPGDAIQIFDWEGDEMSPPITVQIQ